MEVAQRGKIHHTFLFLTCFQFILSLQIKLRDSNILIKFTGQELRNIIKCLHLLLEIQQEAKMCKTPVKSNFMPGAFKLTSLGTIYMSSLVPLHILLVTCRRGDTAQAEGIK